MKIALAQGRDTRTLRQTITALARMPTIDIRLLASFAREEAPDKAVRDMALWALGEADAARGAPELLRALGDERARVAIYALRAVVLDLPAAEAIRLVAGSPLHPVTVGKEAIRLAGELRTPQACASLDALGARDDLHADLRLALMRAYWSYLERPATWDALNAAARSERLGLARAAVAIPQERLGGEARLRLAEHQALLLASPHALVCLEALRRIESMPDRAGASRLRPGAARGDASRHSRSRCASRSPPLIRLGDPAEAGARAALAEPLAFLAAAEELQRRCARAEAGAVEAAAAFVETLAGQGRRSARRFGSRSAPYPLRPCPAWIEREAARLHPDALADALTALRAVAAGPRGEALLTAEPEFARSPEPWARRLGLAIVEARAAAKGWTQALRGRLDAYAADPSLWIAEAAERIVPPARLGGKNAPDGLTLAARRRQIGAMSFPFPVLVCDIGGTNVRFSLEGDAAGGADRCRCTPTPTIIPAWPKRSRPRCPSSPRGPRSVIACGAGPVVDGKLKLTNAPWVIDGRESRPALGLERGPAAQRFRGAGAVAARHSRRLDAPDRPARLRRAKARA